LRNETARGIVGLQANSWEESCDGISSQPSVGVVSGDAQILDRHCETNTAVRRNKDDNSHYASSIAQTMLEAQPIAAGANGHTLFVTATSQNKQYLANI
jgi:hypothetical protein